MNANLRLLKFEPKASKGLPQPLANIVSDLEYLLSSGRAQAVRHIERLICRIADDVEQESAR